VRVTRPDSTLIFFAPVSVAARMTRFPGSLEGHVDYLASAVSLQPRPVLGRGSKDGTATIKAGPNNPVGVVWIGLDLEHYGLHGTPEPSSIGMTASHGCVRLTNWDAARLASLVQPGTPVVFE
jgi:hypothetical protein